MVNLRSLLLEGAIWAYRAVRTQSNAVAKTIGFTLSPTEGQRLILLHFIAGADDYAAGRDIQIVYQDKNSASLGILLSDSVDNVRLKGIPPQFLEQKTEDVPATVGLPFSPLILTGTDKLTIQAVILAQNETFTTAIRAVILGNRLPAIVEIDDPNTTTVVTYNELI